MIFLYVLFSVYILAVNFCAFCLVKRQYDDREESGDNSAKKGEGKLLLIALLGGSATVFATMFALRYRLSDILLMIGLPLLAVLNVYAFFLGFRGIYFLI